MRNMQKYLNIPIGSGLARLGFTCLILGAAAFTMGQNHGNGPNKGPVPAVTREERMAGEFAAQARQLIDAGAFARAEEKARQGAFIFELPGFHVQEIQVKQALAEALLRQKKNGEALRIVREVNKASQDQHTYARVGLLLCRLGKLAESRAMLKDELFTQFTNSKDIIGALPAVNDKSSLEGTWLLAIGFNESMEANDPSALYYFEAAKQFLPKNAFLASRLGKMYLQQGKYALAEGQFKTAVQGGKGELKRDAARDLVVASAKLAGGGPTPTKKSG